MTESIQAAIRLLESEQYPRSSAAIANTVQQMTQNRYSAWDVRRALRPPEFELRCGGWAIREQ